ncbi:MAG: chromosomal replication initiator protein DnaA [candidate division WOR-3 bacterium]|nr:chromosomal replication initiator protein DnaA [candidate division WOR-3 bacterium]
MSELKEQVWSKIISGLSELINQDAITAWFRPLRPLNLDDGSLEVGAPNQFFIEWISEYYSNALSQVLTQLNLKINFTVIPEESSPESTNTENTYSNNTTAAKHISTHNQTSNRLTNQSRLIERYTFDNFIIGESNRFAYAACKAVATAPAKTYNPLFIYGGVGLGKTHLLHAIGNYVKNNNPQAKICYTPAELFFLDLIQSIQERNQFAFNNKYRNLDLLLIDDIHYLKGKERLQEEVFHLFNYLQGMGKQIVFTSDRPPREIPTLEERLVSRLLSGLVCDLKPPDLETRIAILNNKAKTESINIDPEIIYFIAENIKTNIRELEGCLIRLAGYASLTNTPLTLDVCKQVLSDLHITYEKPKPLKIIDVVAKQFGVTVEQLQSKERTANLALGRQVAMYLLRTLLGMSLKEIGSIFGGKDHSTVIHAIEKITELKKSNPDIAQKIQKVLMLINGG